MYSKITNPKTGKRVTTNSEHGKKILKKFMKVLYSKENNLHGGSAMEVEEPEPLWGAFGPGHAVPEGRENAFGGRRAAPPRREQFSPQFGPVPGAAPVGGLYAVPVATPAERARFAAAHPQEVAAGGVGAASKVPSVAPLGTVPLGVHPPQSGATDGSQKRDIHIIGAGPVGLYTALLILDRHLAAWRQSTDHSKWGPWRPPNRPGQHSFHNVNRAYAHIAPNITIWEKRPDKWTSQTRKNVMFLSPSNPIFSLSTSSELKNYLIGNGLCESFPPNYNVGGACRPLRTNRHGTTVIPTQGEGGFAITIWRLQNALNTMLENHQFRANVTIKYGQTPPFTKPGERIPDNIVVIDATGGRSSFMRDLVKYGQGPCTQRIATKKNPGETWDAHDSRDVGGQVAQAPDAYGMTLNIPSHIIAAKLQPNPTSMPRQNRFRLLPMYHLERNGVAGWNPVYTNEPQNLQHRDDPFPHTNNHGYSFYLGINLTQNEYMVAKEAVKGVSPYLRHLNLLPFYFRRVVAGILSHNELISAVDEEKREVWNAFNTQAGHSVLSHIPISIFPIKLGFEGTAAWRDNSKNNTYYLAGDSVASVHFFSGTGINSGMKCAFHIASAIIVDQELPQPSAAGYTHLHHIVARERETLNDYNTFAIGLAQKSMQASCNVDFRASLGGETLPPGSVCNKVRNIPEHRGPQWRRDDGSWIDVTVTPLKTSDDGMDYEIANDADSHLLRINAADPRFRIRTGVGLRHFSDRDCRASNDAPSHDGSPPTTSCAGFDCK